MKCPRNSPSPAGSSSISQCGTGGVTGCPVGTTGRQTAVSVQCVKCSSGMYGMMSNEGLPTCVGCPAGTVSPAGSTSGAACMVSDSSTMTPTMAPTSPSAKFTKIGLKFKIKGVSQSTFASNRAYSDAVNATISSILFSAGTATQGYTYQVESVSYKSTPASRRRLAISNNAVMITANIIASGGSSTDVQTFAVATATSSINSGSFNDVLTTTAKSLGASGLDEIAVSDPVEVQSTPAPPAGTSSAAEAKGSSAGAIVGTLFAISFLIGVVWYYNKTSNEKAAAAAAAEAPVGNPMQLPPNWEEKKTVEGKSYFHNNETGAVQEERPTA